MKSPILITERLRLRPMGWAAEKDYSHWLNDPEVVKFSELRHRAHTPETCKEYIQSFDHQNNHIWAIHIRGDAGKHIGNITAHKDYPNRVAEVGILVGDKSEWGKGYATEAWGYVSEWLLANGVRKLEAGCMGYNTGMIKVFEKTKFKFEAVRPQRFELQDQKVDCLLYGRFA